MEGTHVSFLRKQEASRFVRAPGLLLDKREFSNTCWVPAEAEMTCRV